jgi:hypothetical protein
MTCYRAKPYASIVLFAAMLFAFGNLAHSLEHHYGLEASQTHAECNHCSDEHSAAVGVLPVSTFASLSAEHYAPNFSGHIATPTPSFQVRAPPLR